jgi:hypothetical protein
MDVPMGLKIIDKKIAKKLTIMHISMVHALVFEMVATFLNELFLSAVCAF